MRLKGFPLRPDMRKNLFGVTCSTGLSISEKLSYKSSFLERPVTQNHGNGAKKKKKTLLKKRNEQNPTNEHKKPTKIPLKNLQIYYSRVQAATRWDCLTRLGCCGRHFLGKKGLLFGVVALNWNGDAAHYK